MAKPNIPVDIFHKCHTPQSACKYVRAYAKTYKISVECVCRLLWRYHRLSVDTAMINKCRRHYDSWQSDSRDCAQHHTTVSYLPKTDAMFVASFMKGLV